MNFDPYTRTPIHRGNIWDSGCLDSEFNVQNFFYQWLAKHGWIQDLDSQKTWRCGDRTVIVCLVDDVRSCSKDYHTYLPYLFDKNTTVITDSRIECPTMYQVWKLPASFYGIYAVDDAMPEWTPERHYAFSINRVDTRRLKLVLELAKRVHLHKGFVNFNAQLYTHGLHFKENDNYNSYFEQHWNYLSDEDKAKWTSSYELLFPQIPLKNYEYEHGEIFHRTYLNIECETYSSDNSVALSEKIFRLLTLPVPWTCYLGHDGVAYLESLGFDCMLDIIDHTHYDRLKEVENKIGIFMWKSLQILGEMRAKDFEEIKQRAMQAAQHNRELLSKMRQQWPADFDQWQQQYLPQLM